MRFRDIEKFIVSHYRINMPWDMLEEHITGRYGDVPGGFQLCPEFQRGHVWTEEQQIRYIEYCLRGGISGREIYINFKGHMTNFSGPIVLVDGLQRITAVRRFMNSEIPAFDTLYKDYEDTLGFSEAFFYWNVNDLKTEAEVLQWYIQLNDGGTVHTREEIDRVKALLEAAKKVGK